MKQRVDTHCLMEDFPIEDQSSPRCSSGMLSDGLTMSPKLHIKPGQSHETRGSSLSPECFDGSQSPQSDSLPSNSDDATWLDWLNSAALLPAGPRPFPEPAQRQ